MESNNSPSFEAGLRMRKIPTFSPQSVVEYYSFLTNPPGSKREMFANSSVLKRS